MHFYQSIGEAMGDAMAYNARLAAELECSRQREDEEKTPPQEET